eukprot:422879_1
MWYIIQYAPNTTAIRLCTKISITVYVADPISKPLHHHIAIFSHVFNFALRSYCAINPTKLNPNEITYSVKSNTCKVLCFQFNSIHLDFSNNTCTLIYWYINYYNCSLHLFENQFELS